MWGFVCLQRDAARMKENIDRLRRNGIPVQHMIVVEDCREAFGKMGRGDVLAVCSLRRLADDFSRLRQGLERVRQAGGIVESLEEPWWDMRAGQSCWERLGALYPSDCGPFAPCPACSGCG